MDRPTRLLQRAPALLLVAAALPAGAEPARQEHREPLWRIGVPDDDCRELALAPDGYAGFVEHFGGPEAHFHVGRSSPARDWPYVLPGPVDPWAGRMSFGPPTMHELRLFFDLAALPEEGGACALTIDFVETHAVHPPRLRVSVNGRDHDHPLPAGHGDGAVAGDVSEAREHVLVVEIPREELRFGLNEIRLRHLEGSWTVFDCLTFEAPEGVVAGEPSETLVHSVRPAPFELARGERRVQPLLVDVTRAGGPAPLTLEVEGREPVSRMLEPGRSVLELDLPAVDRPVETRVVLHEGDNGLFATRVARHPAPLGTWSDYVDPFIGTADSRWMLTPGPWMPFGMVKLSPVNEDWRWRAGYEYSIENLMGFSHVHEWTMAGLLVMPTVGPLRIEPGPEDDPDAGYRSRFDRRTERAGIGFYEVVLEDYGVKAELTATTRAALQRYTFPEADDARVLLDLFFPAEYRYELHEARVVAVSDSELEGSARYTCPAYDMVNDYTLHFVVQFDRPFAALGGWVGERVVHDVTEIAGAGDVGCFASFATGEGDVIRVRSAISLVGIEGARRNLEVELGPYGWDFEAVVANARRAWDDVLGRIAVESDDHLAKTKFYTNLYRAYCARTIWSDVDGRYVDMYERVQELDDPDSPIYGCDAFWNTFWNLNQLWNLATPAVSDAWVRSLLEIRDVGGWLPKGPAGIEYSSVMVAEHAIPFVVAAWQHGIRGYDARAALEAAVQAQTTPPQRHESGGHVGNKDLAPYLELGWVPHGGGAPSNTLEYAYDDWCVAQLAAALGESEVRDTFLARARSWRNIFDAGTGFMRPRNPDGSWLEPFDPFHSPGFVEGNAWQYTWFVPHDVAGLIEAMGRERFVARLEEGLARSERTRFNALAERYAEYPLNHGNQPSMQVAWLFNHAGEPWRTQRWVRAILDTYYGTGPSDGYPGDEDQGQMSGWYVMSAIGLFQTDGGARLDPVYEVGSPLFERVTIALDPDYYPGGTFTIVARNASRTNRYVQSAALDGEPLDRPWFPASRLTDGGSLVLELGPEPNREWGTGGSD